MNIINLKKDFLMRSPNFRGSESNLYLYNTNKIVKIFKTNDKTILSNKEHKIDILNSIDEDILKPTNKVYINDKFSGYAMKYEEDSHHMDYYFLRKRDKIKLLKELYKKIEILHKHGIIYGDIHGGNILMDKYGDIQLCDLDNVKIDNYSFDIMSLNGKRYIHSVKEIDEYMDTYMFNLYVIACLNNINSLFAFDYLSDSNNERKFIKNGVNDIRKAMILLDDESKTNIKPLIK